MNRKLTYIFIAALFVMIPFGTALADGFQQHLVQKGETLSEIAQMYEVPLNSIMQANRIKSAHRIRSGRTLHIPRGARTEVVKDVWYTVQPGDTLFSIGRSHNIEWRDIQKINNNINPHRLQIGAKIRLRYDSPGFGKPLRIPLVVTSKHGYRRHPVTGRYQLHEGIDFRAATGTRVYASKAGRVIFAGRKGGYGKIVGIEHENDFTTWYGHLSRIRVKDGETVNQGRVIGLSGNTGISTGPHLHFEIRYKGRSEKPTQHITIP